MREHRFLGSLLYDPATHNQQDSVDYDEHWTEVECKIGACWEIRRLIGRRDRLSFGRELLRFSDEKSKGATQTAASAIDSML